MQRRKMAVIVSAVVVLAGSHQAALAQTRQEEGTSKPRAGRMQKMGVEDRLDRMTNRLDLTEAQQSRIKPILEEEEKQLKALQESARKIRKSTMEKIKPILTPEQQKKAEEMRENAKERWEERRSPMQEGPK